MSRSLDNNEIITIKWANGILFLNFYKNIKLIIFIIILDDPNPKVSEKVKL